MIRSMIKRKDGNIDTVIAQSAAEYRPHRASFYRRRQGKGSALYMEDFAVLDTETSHVDLDGWVYQWAIYFNGDYIYGRTPTELISVLEAWRQFYGLGPDKHMICYIHNLSYDIQYLKWYLREWDPETSFFVTDSHTCLIVDTGGIRICCSYKLTNMSLARLAKDYSTTYVKAVGEIDYTQVRYQDTPLGSRDWLYMLSDVASQYDGVRGYLTAMGYKRAADAPFTSTGFVRNSCRRESEKQYWHEDFIASALSLDMYRLVRQGFIGGQTITSWLYAGDIVEGVGHCDFTSAYPFQQMAKYFPMGPGFWAGAPDSMEDLDRLLGEFCVVALYHFTEIEIRPGITAPYIPGSKGIHPVKDRRINGKLISAEDFSIVLTELDFKWVRKQYKWEDLEVSNVLCFQRGPLPDFLKTEVMKYYTDKTLLKHQDPVRYAASKALLNSIYGMCATAIVREQYAMDENLVIVENEDISDQEQLDKFYGSRKSFLPYQYGVYVTAHARDELHTLIEAVGYDNFLYCDTDSIFYLDRPECRAAIREYNDRIRAISMAAGAYVDSNNILGIATDEEDCKRFKSLHAKCYAWEDAQDQLHVTIAGISKSATKWVDGSPVTMTSAEELGTLEALQDGFTFHHTGGSRVIYVEDEPRILTINGHRTELASAAIIEDIDKTISDRMYTYDREYILQHLEFIQVLE